MKLKENREFLINMGMENPSKSNRMRVLIVDDDSMTRHSLCRLLALECPAWDCLLALAFALASTCPVFIHSCFGFLACSSMACKLLKLLCACVAVASSLDIDMPSVDLLPSTMGCLGVPSKHCIFFWANAVLHA